MLPKAVVASTDRLTVAAVRCAWSQWASIGALTLGLPQVADEIVDIEALLLGSLGLAQREPRLRTLATNWTMRNSELVSIARLRALLEGPFAGAESGSASRTSVSTEAAMPGGGRLLSGGDRDRVGRSTREKAMSP